ncbi:MAG: HAMP domain-containing sensor histidine kinase [Salinivirgaceae bacterium]|jgi:signal transduction histidine kinase|nr:HAMP domain-containing sensor histidine kinase [Salinivirgaceae bacterium]
MNFYTHKKRWKVALFIVAIIIGVLSLTYTGELVNKMKVEERKNMEIWAQAQAALASTEDMQQDVTFYANIISKNTTIPVILTDKNDSIITPRNFTPKQELNEKYLYRRLAKMKQHHERIEIDLGRGVKNYIYYEDSTILKQLSIYPYVQLGIISLFILVAYFAFSSSRKAEQNQVWVGMSKETAHQLGTPISSLMAWVEILEQSDENKSYIHEMEKDVNRLQMIAERFSKIGSIPDLPLADLRKSIDSAMAYMKTRTSDKINFSIHYNTTGEVILPLNNALFNWVIENLIKNSVDAMEGKGTIKVYLVETDKDATIEITDSGKGMPKSIQKTIFSPGYTSKERGWGLGLSLAKRIIENYHQGKIFVQNSEINLGTTIKIILPK